VKIVPYLFFDGTCEAAMNLYAKVLGGRIDGLMRFKDMPADQQRPGMDQKVVHAHLVADGCELMASDAPSEYFRKAQGVAVSVHVDKPAEADRIFNALGEGGEISMPIGKTFWAERFGMLTDRFGTPWMIDCPPAAG
jgi:PhnB protein